MPSKSRLLKSLLALPALVTIALPAYAQSFPTITKIRFHQEMAGVTAEIFGTEFGTSPVKLPCRKCNISELEFGFIGQPMEPVTITKWTDSYIRLTGLSADAGQTAVLAVKNDSLGTSVAGTQAVPGGPSRPRIRRISLSHFHGHLRIVINGRGFGSAPKGVPGNTDIPNFQFVTWVKGGTEGDNYPWSAGGSGGGGNDVTLNYVSWTDTRIEIKGFGGAYGENGWTVAKGDPVVAVVYNNPGGGGVGPGSAVASRAP
jgi:hypothetical protein